MQRALCPPRLPVEFLPYSSSGLNFTIRCSRISSPVFVAMTASPTASHLISDVDSVAAQELVKRAIAANVTAIIGLANLVILFIFSVHRG